MVMASFSEPVKIQYRGKMKNTASRASTMITKIL